jgi:hypothetical protein
VSTAPETREGTLEVGSAAVSTLWTQPENARVLLVLAHGAGADMRHAFMQEISLRLAARGIATLRYQFPYAERGARRPDPRAVLLATVRAAVAAGAAAGLPLFAGGKSMGGRMTSLAASEAPLAGVRGIVFLGFPLHPAREPGVERAEHLAAVSLPLLFVQGTRDALARMDLLRPVVSALGARARLVQLEGADHSFRVPRRAAQAGGDPLDAMAGEVASFCRAH